MAVATGKGDGEALLRALGEFAVFVRTQQPPRKRRVVGGAEKRAVLAWMRGLRVDELASLCCVEDVCFVKTLLHMAALSRSSRRSNARVQEFQLLPLTVSAAAASQYKRPSSKPPARTSAREFLRRPLLRTADGDVIGAFHSREYEDCSDAVLRGLRVLNTLQSCDTVALSMAFFDQTNASSAAEFFCVMEVLSHGEFLTACPSEATLKRRVWGETKWLAAQGYYSFQALFINQIELNIWACWKQHKKAMDANASVRIPLQGLVAKLYLVREWEAANESQREATLKVLATKTTAYLRDLRQPLPARATQAAQLHAAKSALETLTSVLESYQQRQQLRKRSDRRGLSVDTYFTCSLEDAVASPQAAVVKLLLAEHLQEQCSLLLCDRLSKEEEVSAAAKASVSSSLSERASAAVDGDEDRAKGCANHSQRRRASRKKMLKQRRLESEARAAQQTRLQTALKELREYFQRKQQQARVCADEVVCDVISDAVERAEQPAGGWSASPILTLAVSEREADAKKTKRKKRRQKKASAAAETTAEVQSNNSSRRSLNSPDTPRTPIKSPSASAKERRHRISIDAEGDTGELSAATAGSDSSSSQHKRPQLLDSNSATGERHEDRPRLSFFSNVDPTSMTTTPISPASPLSLPTFGSQSLYSSSSTTPFFMSLAPSDHPPVASRALRSRRDAGEQDEDCENNQLSVGSPSRAATNETADSSNFEWHLPSVFSLQSSTYRSVSQTPALDWHFNHWQFKSPDGGPSGRTTPPNTPAASGLDAPLPSSSSSSSTSSASSLLANPRTQPLGGATKKYSLASFSKMAGVEASRRRPMQAGDHDRLVTTVGVAREDGEAVEIDTESDFLYREGGFFDRQRALKRRRRPRPFDYDHEEDEEEIAEEHQARSEERRHGGEGGSRRCADASDRTKDGAWTECVHCCQCACHRASRRRSNADADDQQEAEASESNHCEHHRPDGATDSSVAATKADNDNDSIAKLTAALARISQLETNLAEKTKTVDEQAANTSADVTALQQTVSMLTAQLRSVETDIHELQLAQAAASVNMAAMDESLGNRSSCSSPPASFSPAPSSVGQPIDNTAVVPPPLPDAYAANSVMGPFVSVPLSVLPPRSKLHWDLCEFAAQLQTDSDARLPAQLAAQRLCTATVQSLWPRAQVRPYGSHVTRLVLPSSDVDLVICLPKVRRDAPADAAGMLEGRNAIKETWQQNLARKLRQEPWVVPDSVKTLPHAAIPIITLLTAPPYNVRLDISFEGPGHNGLATNDVVLALLHEFPPLAPMMLVLKSFAIERGLAVAYSGGLSSYALLLLLARYLQEHSDTMPNGFANASRAVQHSLSAAQAGVADFGLMLMGFLDFYGNRFDPRTTGISVASRCFLNRESTFLAGATAASSSGMDDSPHQHQQYQQQYAADDAAVDDRTSQYGYAQHWQVPTHPYTQPPAPNTDMASTHGLRRYGYRSSLDLPVTRAANGMATGLLDYQQQLQTYDPHKFDPVFIEDPLSPSNNVGRNCFRIMQIRRAFSAAHLALLAASRDPTVFAENRMPLVAGVGLHPDNILRAILGPSAPVNAKPDATATTTVGTPYPGGVEHPYAFHPYNHQQQHHQQQYVYHHHQQQQQHQQQQSYHHVGVPQPRSVSAYRAESGSRRHSESESEKMTTRSVTSAADHYERARKERVGSPRLVPQNHSQILSQPHQQARRSRHGATTQAQHSQPNLSQSDVQETGSGTNRKPNERSMSLSLSFADVVRDGGGSSGGAASSRAMLHKSPLALARSTRFWRDDLALEESINERWETKDDSELK